MTTIAKFLRDEDGMETLEYALIAGLIAAAAVIVYSTGWANVLATKLNDAVNASAS
jgi:Flp pilus assembly pilin Flp